MHSITQIEKKVNRKIQKKYIGVVHGGVGGVCKIMKQEHRRKQDCVNIVLDQSLD